MFEKLKREVGRLNMKNKNWLFNIICLLIMIACSQAYNPDRIDLIVEQIRESEFSQEFNLSIISQSDSVILSDFTVRRETFDWFIKEKNLELFSCPGCGFPTLSGRGDYEICDVCNWEDDGQDDKTAIEVWGGSNKGLSLIENRIKISRVLNAIADSVDGQIIKNPEIVMELLESHSKRMNSMSEMKLMHANRQDPIWREWTYKSHRILYDLVNDKAHTGNNV